MRGVVMSVFSQLAHLTTNTCHRRSDIADAPGLRRLCADQTQIRRRADTERFCGTAGAEVVFALVGHASGASYARSTAATRTRGHHLAQHRRVPERLGCRAGAEVVHNELDLWVAQTLDRHEGTPATLADHFEQEPRIIRQVFPRRRQLA